MATIIAIYGAPGRRAASMPRCNPGRDTIRAAHLPSDRASKPAEPSPALAAAPATPPRAAPGPVDAQRFLRQVDWNLFAQFFHIVQSGSLSAAGRRLNLQQPSLSAALKRLEDHLGVVLCQRGSRGISLTPAGKALLKLCEDMMEAARMAPHMTSQAAGRIQGALRMRVISNVVSPEFDAALASFHRRHPNVAIHVDVASWPRVLEALSDGLCQIGVTFDSGPRATLQYEPLFRETQQLYCGPAHPLYGQRVRDPAILCNEAFVLTNEDEPEDLRRFRMRFGLGSNAAGHAEDLNEVSRLIRLGVGIGFMPTVVAEPFGEQHLWPLLSVSVLPSYFIYLIAPPPARMTIPAQLFLDEVRRRMRARTVL